MTLLKLTRKQLSILIGVFLLFFCLLTAQARAAEHFPFSPLSLLRELRIGMRSHEIKALQVYLNTHNAPVAIEGAGSKGKETTYFGRLTKTALERLQQITGEKTDPTSSTEGEIKEPLLSAQRYSISGSVTGVSGVLILKNNQDDTLTIKPGQSSSFTFLKTLADGQPYVVTVAQTPSGQQCYVSSFSNGIVHAANITNIQVMCSSQILVNPFSGSMSAGGGSLQNQPPQTEVTPSRYVVGGIVSGLTGTLVLQNNASDNLTLTSNGAFSFVTTMTDESDYSVTILTQPAGQTCSLTSGTGIIHSRDINSVNISCATDPISPSITFSPLSKNYGDDSFGLSPISNSTGTFAYLSSDPSVATVSGATVTIVGAGTTVLTATQSAAYLYLSSAVTTTLTVLPIAPALSFPAISKNYGDPSFSLSASSDGDGSIHYLSSNPSVASLSGSTVTITGAGTTTLTATQSATTNYTSGSTTTLLTVHAIAPSITFHDLTKNYGDAPFALSPTSDSAGAFSYLCTDEGVATVVGNIVTIVGAGIATITANQASNGNYTASSQSAILTINAITPTIGLNNIEKFLGQPPFSPSPTSTSAGSFSYMSSRTSVATVSGSTITIVGAGTSTITVFQTANGNYLAGSTTALLTVYVDECITAPCLNGGICTPFPGTFSCSCSEGYSGDICESDASNCSPDGGSSCLNGGICIPSPTHGECSCPACYTGSRCDEYSTECA